MSKVIIVSNRLPISVHVEKEKFGVQASFGGLATGLKSVHAKENSLWFGWSGIPSDGLSAKQDKALAVLLAEHRCVGVPLTNSDLEGYYYGFSNRTIWPLFHYFSNLADFDDALFDSYRMVNERFLDLLSDQVNEDDTIWVHDYQLLLLPLMLRNRFPRAKIGLFLHIPFPSYELFRLMPQREEILMGMLGADLIGFHTYDYVRHFLSSVRRLLRYDFHKNQVLIKGRAVGADVFPMGIDYQAYTEASKKRAIREETADVFEKVKGMQVVLSIDRLDYTKGILERIRAYTEFIRRNPRYREKVALIMIVAPSRVKVGRYQELLKEIEEAVSHANGELGSMGWTPVWFFYRTFQFENITALYGLADVMLVTPLRDGMNLVAKEYIATRTDQLGMLVISETAGAASELSEAILVNPNDISQVAEGIKTALELTKVEQIERNTAMHRRLKHYDVEYWADDFLKKLDAAHLSQQKSVALKLSETVALQIVEDYAAAKKPLFFLDYDGTLVSFVDKPSQAGPDKALLDLLTALATDRNTEVIIVSGRDHDVLDEWFDGLPIHLVASHGLWRKQRGEKWELAMHASAEWKKMIRPVLELHTFRTPGSEIEEKSYTLSWHYRRCDPDLALLRLGELRETLVEMTQNLQVGILEGNKVLEIKDTAVDKGRGVLHFLRRFTSDFVLCVGDDWTDEDMFTALPRSSITIRVGMTASNASYHLESVADVRKLLASLKRRK